jgi:hypothetical protein
MVLASLFGSIVGRRGHKVYRTRIRMMRQPGKVGKHAAVFIPLAYFTDVLQEIQFSVSEDVKGV